MLGETVGKMVIGRVNITVLIEKAQELGLEFRRFKALVNEPDAANLERALVFKLAIENVRNKAAAVAQAACDVLGEGDSVLLGKVEVVPADRKGRPARG